MNLRNVMMALILSVSGSAIAGEVDIFSMNEVAVAQENSDGSFSVVCTDGTRENVSAVDFRLGNVCPFDDGMTPTNILSVQKRDDGNFDVVCRDLTKVIASEEEILDNEVCTDSQAVVVIEDGVYSSSGANDCTIEGVYTSGRLTGLKAAFPGTTSNMTCANNVCQGRFSGYSQLYQIEVLTKTSFEFSYDGGSGRRTFTKRN